MRGGLLIIGLDNPQSSDPRHALFPHPKGCAGHRLYNMILEVDAYFDRAQYMSIPKSNLFPCGRMPTKQKKGNLTMAAQVLIASVQDTDKKVVLLGNEVRNAVFGDTLGKTWPMAKFTTLHGARFAWIPHPSGRNPFYNDTRNRRKIGRFLKNARMINT